MRKPDHKILAEKKITPTSSIILVQVGNSKPKWIWKSAFQEFLGR